MTSIRHITAIPSTNHQEAPSSAAPLRRTASLYSHTTSEHHASSDSEGNAFLDNVEANLVAKEADQQAELSTSTRVARQPPNPDSFPVASFDRNVVFSSQSLAVGGGDANASGALGFDRTGAMARGAMNVGGHDVAGMGSIVVRNAYGEVAVQANAHDKFTVGILNGAGVHGSGLTATQTLPHASINEGFFVVGDAAQDAKVVANREKDDHVQVAFKDKKFLGLQVTVGGSHGLFGAGVRGYVAKGRDYQLKRWLPPIEAKRATAKQNLLFQKLRSLGLMAQPFERPDLYRPLQTMQVGDEVSFVKQKTFTGGVAAALGGIYFGLHASLNKEIQLLVERTTASTMRVTASPKAAESTTAGASVDLPLLAAATLSISRSKARLFSFEFDLNVDEAMEAYLAILDFRMPSNMIDINPSYMENPKLTLQALSRADMFGPGIKLVSLAYGKRELDVHLSVGLTGLPNLFGDWVGMMGYRRRMGQSQLIAVSPTTLLERKEATQESRFGLLRRGETKIVAKVVEENTNTKAQGYIKQEQAIYLEAALSHVRPTAKTAKKMLKWTNKNFFDNQLTLNASETSLSKKYSYGVVVKRMLNDQDLIVLWQSGKLKNLALPEDGAFDVIDDKPELSDEQRTGILSSLKVTVAKDGVDAIRVVNDVLGDVAALEVSIAHDPVKEIEGKMLEKSIKFATPISRETSAKELLKRISTAEKHFDSLSAAQEAIESDPLNAHFDAEQLSKSKADIEKLRGEAMPYLNISHLSRAEQKDLLGALPQAKRIALLNMTPKRPTNLG